MSACPLSVVVPIYNTEEYLRECLESLASQTLENIEIIVVDDGSTDGSSEIVDEYASKKPKIFRVIHQKNGGQSAARNAGIALATGDYIGFADSDDICNHDMFDRLYRAARSGDFDHVSCNYRGFIMDPMTGARREARSACGGNDRGIEGLYYQLSVSPPLHIWKRELFNRAKVRFVDAQAYEDVAFYYEAIAYVESTCHLDEPLYSRRWRKGSLMTSASYSGVVGLLDTARTIIAFYEDRQIPADKELLVKAALLRILLLSHMSRCVSLPLKKEARGAVEDTIEFVRNEFPFRRDLEFGNGIIGAYLRYFPLSLMPTVSRFRLGISKFKHGRRGGI